MKQQQCFKSLLRFLVFTLLTLWPQQRANYQGDPLWRLRVWRGNEDGWCAEHKGETLHTQSWPYVLTMDQRSRKTKICKQSFVHKCLQVTRKYFQRTVCSLSRWQVPLAFYLNLFGIMDTRICPLIGNVNGHYIAYIPQLSQSVCSDAMVYVGALLLDNTRNTEQCEGPNRWQS